MNSNRLGKITTLILALFFIVYAAFQAFRFLFTSYSTESAYMFEVARVYTTNGLILRQEHALTESYDGALSYTLPEGGKFISTTPIATRYSDAPTAQQAEHSKALEKERTILLESQKLATAKSKPDIAGQSDEIYTTLRRHMLDTAGGGVSDTASIRNELLHGITSIKASVNSSTSYTGRIAELEEEIGLAQTGSVITVEDSGYFSRFTDKQEQNFSPELAESLTVEELDSYLAWEYPYDYSALGRCITDYNWYYVTTIPLTEVELFQPDVRLNLSFVGGEQDEPVSGWVKSVTEDKDAGRALLVIQSNDLSADTVSRRTATVQLGFDDYQGIRFSKKALRIQDGVKGVFVRGKSSIIFKKVNIVYTGADFYLSKLDYNSNTDLNIFDEIVVEGTNLYDGKPLES